MKYPREWHLGRMLLLVTWLTATTSYAALFIGATYEGEGFSPKHLLLAQLVTQAILLAVALLSHYGKLPPLADWLREQPRRVIHISLAAQGTLLVVIALAMIPWNDEVSNLEQARFLAENGLGAWTDNYATLNSWMGPHHPPLLALMYGLFYAIVGPHLLAGRLLNVVFAVAALAVGTRIVRRLTDEPTAALASLCWPLFPIWLFNGAAALLEGPFLLILLLTVDAFINFLRGQRTAQAVIVGLWLTVGLLARYNIALIVPAMVAVLAMPDYRHLAKRPGTWWLAGVPLLIIAPLAGMAAGSGLMFTQAARLSWMALLLRPGGAHYLVEYILPLWPLQVGAYLVPLFLLALLALWFGKQGDRVLLLFGGVLLLLVGLTLPNPRYLLPVVPFFAAGIARMLQRVEQSEHGLATAWLGIFGTALTLTVLVIVGSSLSDFYPFY